MNYKEKVQKSLEDFQKGDIQSIVDICDDNIKWTNPDAPEVPFALSFTGKDKVAGFFGKLAETIDVTKFEVDRYIVEGSCVVTWGSYDATVKSTGKSFTTPLMMLWEFNTAGKCTNWHAQTNTSAQAKAFSKN